LYQWLASSSSKAKLTGIGDSGSFAMTRNEYERIYLEALEFLRCRGRGVEDPYTNDAGIRFARVDKFPSEDDLVFAEAWGRRVAERIARLRPPVLLTPGESFFAPSMVKMFRHRLRVIASAVHGLSTALRPRS
jgi:hypothetical protein